MDKLGRKFPQNSRLALLWEHLSQKAAQTLRPTAYVENELIQLEKLANESREAWRGYLAYLEEQRELIKPEIIESLRSCITPEFSFNNSRFSTKPLSAAGSINFPGGRFNIQRLNAQYFHALYLGSDYQTAYNEKYLARPEVGSPLTPEEFSLKKVGSFLHSRVNGKLDSVLDLREARVFESFYSAISNIKVPPYYRRLGFSLMKDAEVFKNLVFADDYSQWETWLSHPAHSQWFAYYAKEANVSAIVYPSVRNSAGINLAIILDSFEYSSSEVTLVDDNPGVAGELKSMNSENFQTFKK